MEMVPFAKGRQTWGGWIKSWFAKKSKPAAGQPALISFDDVTTMFHEFGHALHGMFSNVKYPSIAGTATSRDFVEFPSQFNEHWALDPKVFANYAKHYKTGEAMPQELVDKILKARSFNQGYATTEYLSAALLDLAGDFAPVGRYLEEQGLTLAELANASPQVAALEELQTPTEVTAEAAVTTADAATELVDETTAQTPILETIAENTGAQADANAAGMTQIVALLTELLAEFRAARSDADLAAAAPRYLPK